VLKTSADSFQPGSGSFDGEDDLRGEVFEEEEVFEEM